MTRLRICVAWPRAWAGLPVECRRVDLRLHLPLHPGLRARHGIGRRRSGLPVCRRQPCGEGLQRHHDDLSRRLGGRRPKQRIEWLEQDIRSGDQRDPADGEPPWRGTLYRNHRDRVADPGLQRGGQLLVEHDAAGREAALEHAQCAEVCEVVRRNGEDRSAGRGDAARRAVVARLGKRRRRGRRRLQHVALACHGGGDGRCLSLRADRSLPVEGHGTDRRRRHGRE